MTLDQPARAAAELSECGRYRYTLDRALADDADPLDRVTWVMLNPSTADARLDDPTIRRCVGFTRRLGHDTLRVVNLMAYRATNPDDLRTAHDPVGPKNTQHLANALTHAARWGGPVVCAWGAGADGIPEGRAATAWMIEAAEIAGVTLRCLGTTKDGHPRHPLYLPGDTPLIEWQPT